MSDWQPPVQCPKCGSTDTRFVEPHHEMSIYECNVCDVDLRLRRNEMTEEFVESCIKVYLKNKGCNITTDQKRKTPAGYAAEDENAEKTE